MTKKQHDDEQAPQVDTAELNEAELDDVAGGGNSVVEHNGTGYAGAPILNN
jgi:hypothetical protein